MTETQRLVELLVDAGVEFVIIGGVALVLRGSGRTTVDLDVCYARDRENLKRLAAALAPLEPRLRGAPAGLPFLWDDRTLASGLNFTLTTALGDLDILGEVSGLGGFDRVRTSASPLDLFGRSVLVLDLDGLERAKRAAGRAKDLLDLAEIAAIRKKGG